MKVRKINIKKNIRAEKNLDLIHHYLQEILKHPEKVDNIPNGAYVIHLPLYDKWLLEENLVLAKQCVLEGEPVLLLPVHQDSSEETSNRKKHRKESSESRP